MERPNITENLYEYLLRQILGQFPIASHIQCQAVHLALKAVIQSMKCLSITGLASPNKLVVQVILQQSFRLCWLPSIEALLPANFFHEFVGFCLPIVELGQLEFGCRNYRGGLYQRLVVPRCPSKSSQRSVLSTIFQVRRFGKQLLHHLVHFSKTAAA